MIWIKENTQLILTLVMTSLLVLPIHYLSGHLHGNTSPSLNTRWLWVTDGEIDTGDYVVFDYKHDLMPEGLTRLSKRVGCLYPQYIRIESLDYFCDGIFLGTALETNSKGELLPHFKINGQIPQGQAFLVGDHPHSFDSRYFGLIDVNQLHRAVALLGE